MTWKIKYDWHCKINVKRKLQNCELRQQRKGQEKMFVLTLLATKKTIHLNDSIICYNPKHDVL